ncbi:hypothetical protein CO172_00915 [Candidatus Uhrbacteria bacterium CG_4_9_14_3_um_filter_36_7]|uniref:HEAT repeat domain-containing protein n=1 Tax=Candidatus Uhrbacteria bacterium CG_4_9_14_3_um_filter_36_7 TaxID=1975033 RepID=A0A2M7XI34_9BACT|nr:MAG: hypothetical protein CO172_00915 [Candidatus Uhrbacteria bacterium CG_4_9_14_3_um_filter_36_7]
MVNKLLKWDKSLKYFLTGFALLFLIFIVIYLVWLGKDLSSDVLPPLATVSARYTPQSSRSMQNVDEYVMKGVIAIEEAKPLLTSKKAQDRWVAVYVIGRVSDVSNAQILLPLLQDEDEIVRISVAGTLANKGYTEALPVLIEAVDSTNSITYLHPEREISDFSLEVLMTYTDQNFVLKNDWLTWWDKNQSHLSWNTSTKQYE